MVASVALTLTLMLAQPPASTGTIPLIAATWLGGPHDDELTGVAIAAEGSIVVVGNSPQWDVAGLTATVFGPAGVFDTAAMPPPADPKKKNPPKFVHPSTHGVIARLSADGQRVLSLSRFGYGMATIRKLRTDPAGNILLLGFAPKTVDFGMGGSGMGTFIAQLAPDASKLTRIV
ncbi:MAG: hypothetical protein ACRCZF_00655, partial [Gemmataceae bacterium]